MKGTRVFGYVGMMAFAAMAVFALGGCGNDSDQADHAGHDHDGADHSHGSAVMAATVQTTCPVMEGNPINKNLFVEHEGKKVYFCCASCVDAFKADPDKYLDKLPQFKDTVDKATSEAQSALDQAGDAATKLVAAATEQTVCPVMGNPINKDVFVEYKGKKVYFCCAGCDEKFQADPEQYLAKLPQFQGSN